MDRQQAENEDGLAYYFDDEEGALVFTDYGRRLLTKAEREQLVELWVQRGKKREEICSHVAETLGYGTNVAALSDEIASQIAEEVEELMENWEEDVEDSIAPGSLKPALHPNPGIQQLLAGYFALVDRVQLIQYEAWVRESGHDTD
jgi:hypothetical protein